MTSPTVHSAEGRLHEAMVTGDNQAARALLGELLDEGVAGSALIIDLLAPAQAEAGLLWERGEWTVGDEQVATAVIDAALAVVEANTAPTAAGGVLLAATCAESEWHTLPARMAAQLMREGGAQVRFLGPSMPADHLREYLARLQPDALILSTTMPTSLPGAARSIEAAHDAGIPVIAGGAAFGGDATLATRLGAAAWLADARHLGELSVPHLDASPPTQLAWREFLALEHAAPDVTSAAYQALLESRPALQLMTAARAARTREDLGHILSFLAVSVLVGQERVMRDFTAWLANVLQSRGLPPSTVQASYRAIGHQLDPETSARLTAMADEVACA